MKKNTIPKLIFIILIVILIIAIIVLIRQNNENDLTINLYNEICEKESYTFKMDIKNSDSKYTLTFVKNGNDVVIDTLTNEEHSATLVQDDYIYVIMHDEEEYTVLDFEGFEFDVDVIKDNLKEVEEKDYENGYEQLDGKKYYYEEYSRSCKF